MATPATPIATDDDSGYRLPRITYVEDDENEEITQPYLHSQVVIIPRRSRQDDITVSSEVESTASKWVVRGARLAAGSVLVALSWGMPWLSTFLVLGATAALVVLAREP